MKTICKMLGGSHSYGLQTPSSDIDHRGVFLHTDPNKIFGLSCNVAENEHIVIQDETQDVSYKELRKALRLLREANTEMVELLYNERWVEIDSLWKYVIKKRDKLVDTEKLYKCLKGYMQGELKLANGERTGKLGGKRKEAIDTYGFSPKNFVQLFRLAECGVVYFQKGYFPINIMEENKSFGQWLLDIKVNPTNHSRAELNSIAAEAEKNLDSAYSTRKYVTTFDEDVANEICYGAYSHMLQNEYVRRLAKL